MKSAQIIPDKEVSKPALIDSVINHLESLGYYHADFSIYCLDFENSPGIQVSWNRPNDDRINIQLFDKYADRSGSMIRGISTLDQAKAIISGFHLANEAIQELSP